LRLRAALFSCDLLKQRKHLMPVDSARFRMLSLRLTCCSAALLVALGAPVQAETLKEALTAAYLYNPTLKAARAQLRATDNQVPLAKSGYRPTITGTLQYGYEDVRTKTRNAGATSGEIPVCVAGVNPATGACNAPPAFGLPLSSLSGGGGGKGHPRQAQVALQQNVFDGFRTYNNIKGAEAGVEAGREDLRASEENILLNAATAYMNVVRDQAIVNLRQNNVKVLSEQLRATQDRFKVGEVTRTDVAQAQSGLAQAQADLSIAQGTLYGDRAQFAQYTGHQAGTLRDPGPPAKLLPKSLQQAIDIAEAENPGILGAIFRERAQEHQVKQVKGQLLPSLSFNASYSRSEQPFGQPSVQDLEDTRVYGQLNVPLYEAGSVSAQIRQAIETLSQRRQQIDEARELARQNVSSQWGLLIAAKGNVAAAKSAVEATKIALQGVREEEKVGQRTLLDVLNSEQQYLNAQVNLVSFQRDLVVTSYGVLASMGRLTAYDIALQAELYDPARYYGEVADAWFGWGASLESEEDPRVAPVTDPARTPEQKSTGGPVYTQDLPQIP
jgi:outer membrane protein